MAPPSLLWHTPFLAASLGRGCRGSLEGTFGGCRSLEGKNSTNLCPSNASVHIRDFISESAVEYGTAEEATNPAIHRCLEAFNTR